MTIGDTWLAEMVWGRNDLSWPRHWRSVLKQILRGLTWLHITDLPGDGNPAFGADSVLLTHVGDLRGTADDDCPGDCGVPRNLGHHHFQVDIGPGFLGVLEQFGLDHDGTGVRDYQFPIGTRRAFHSPSLRALGKSGRLVSAFSPALIGDPTLCQTLSEGAHRILQTLVRETTRPVKNVKGVDPQAEVVVGSRLRTYSGRTAKPCKLLNTEGQYVGFNGNGKRRAMGYRLLASDWTWLTKTGYQSDAVPEFLHDLSELATALELVVVGVGPSNNILTLHQLRGLAQTVSMRRPLSSIDVRVFANADYAQRWATYFGVLEPASGIEDDADLDVHVAMQSQKVSCRTLATEIGCDHSFLAKILRGKKGWPETLLKSARTYFSRDRSVLPATSATVGQRNNATSRAAATRARDSR